MTKAVVVGASGYSGAELVGLLVRHPRVELVGLFGSLRRAAADAPARFDDLFPRFRGVCSMEVKPFDPASAPDADVYFLATPTEVSHDVAPALVRPGRAVVDLSAAFRLRDAEVFERTYGFAHAHAGLQERSAYGLPEVNRARIARADLIACAGCYATSAILPLATLARLGAIDLSWEPIVDSISGVSGAGRGASQTVHFCEVSVQPYKALAHRHAPEMAEQIGSHVHFTPHLGCYDRGILSTMHARLAPGWTGARVREALAAAWSAEPFVRLLPAGALPAVASCERTNYCDVGLVSDDDRRHLLVVSAIDNLVKGAAGQAVQCMNIRLGLPEMEGLL